MHTIISFLRKWSLPTGMLFGAAAYLTMHQLPLSQMQKQDILYAVSILQPMFIFAMLLLTFIKISISDLTFKKWQVKGIVYQVLFWTFGVIFLEIIRSHINEAIYFGIEAFLICMICPTATASSVVTRKLGGNTGTITFYIICINLFSALFISLMVPVLYSGNDVVSSFFLISAKIFPLLITPFIVAQILRRYFPKLTRYLLLIPDLAFYLWIISLSLAIAVTVRNIINTHCDIKLLITIAIGSCVAAILQFSFGRYIGREQNDYIASSQALGQKNTVFAIWMGATFMSPVSAVAGGFYSLWHNLWNSYQLNKVKQVNK